MASGNHYVLGYRQAEQERLQRQAEELGHESARLFDEIGIPEGARVLEIGCGPRGCLDLLSARVGASGRVVGVEISADALALAQTFITERGLQNVEVIAGDARSTGLPKGSFDLVTSRLILVTIPQPEQIIAEAVALARPGGAVAFHEADRAAAMCDPPSQAWDTAEKLFMAVAEKNGNDFYLGRTLPRLLRKAHAGSRASPIERGRQLVWWTCASIRSSTSKGISISRTRSCFVVSTFRLGAANRTNPGCPSTRSRASSWA